GGNGPPLARQKTGVDPWGNRCDASLVAINSDLGFAKSGVAASVRLVNAAQVIGEAGEPLFIARLALGNHVQVSLFDVFGQGESCCQMVRGRIQIAQPQRKHDVRPSGERALPAKWVELQIRANCEHAVSWGAVGRAVIKNDDAGLRILEQRTVIGNIPFNVPRVGNVWVRLRGRTKINVCIPNKRHGRAVVLVSRVLAKVYFENYFLPRAGAIRRGRELEVLYGIGMERKAIVCEEGHHAGLRMRPRYRRIGRHRVRRSDLPMLALS